MTLCLWFRKLLRPRWRFHHLETKKCPLLKHFIRVKAKEMAGKMDMAQAMQNVKKRMASIQVERTNPPTVDAGLLAVYDENLLDASLYKSLFSFGNGDRHLTDRGDARQDMNAALAQNARDLMQLAINSIWALPTDSTDNGVLAQLPPPIFKLPREKPVHFHYATWKRQQG